MTKPIGRGRNPVARPAPLNNTRWREVFLEKLAETSNITASAEWAHISSAQVYASRRGEPEFARKWMNALCEGYDLLELELLNRLRSGENKEPTGPKFDNATALRLLAAHRATVGRERALRDNRSEQAVLDSIDAFIDRMRERSASNALILDEPAMDDLDEEI